MSAEVFLAFEVAHTQTLRPLEYTQAKQKPRQEAASAPHGPSSSVGRELWSTRGQGHSKVLPAFLLPASLCPWEVFHEKLNLFLSFFTQGREICRQRLAQGHLDCNGTPVPTLLTPESFPREVSSSHPIQVSCCENPGLQADI